MSPEEYFAAGAEDAFERERIGLLELLRDPMTIRRFEELGVGEGWNCLEIGAGGGSIALWLAKQVGSGGRVVAADIDTKLLHDLDMPNIEIRQHDILTDDIEEGRYDLVHCRAVLSHLAEPEKGLEHMAAAIRPGGLIFIEDQDVGSYAAVDPEHPSADFLNTTSRAMFDVIQKRDIMNPYFGRRICGLLERFGFLDLGNEGIVRIIRGGEPAARFLLMSAQLVFRPMVAAGLFTEEQYAHAERLLQDPSFYFIGPTIFGAWGRHAS